MTKNYDEIVDLEQGSDTGENNALAVQPIGNNETIWPEVANRPIENLRARTETLRRSLESLLYFADYDRGLLLRADGPFTFTEVTPGKYSLGFATPAQNLWVYPVLTPGRLSGGRVEGGRVFCENPSAAGAWTPYSGTPASDDLILTAHRQTTGQRGYADADDIGVTATARSLGANRIFVTLVADSGRVGGAGTITAAITGAPRTKITITYGTSTTPTTLAHLISFINADRTSQGTYGVADFLFASTTGTTSNPPVPFADGQVQGAYDAEAHQVTTAQFTAFFAALDGAGDQANLLLEGEGLAIGYPLGPVEGGVALPRGGRRQSIWDLPTDRVGTRTQNTTPSAGWSLFSTGREPEKIPGSIPIGKVINGRFVFIDGTQIAANSSLSLGESLTMYAVLASTAAGTDGARLIGYEGSGDWHSDAAGTTSPRLPSATVNSTLSRIVADLARSTASQSGARRIGIETLLGDSTVGNETRIYNLGSGSLRAALADLLIAANGINRRVSEFGHRMSGPSPLRKEFAAADMPARGSTFLQGELHAPGNLAGTSNGVNEYHELVLQPLVYESLSDAANDYLLATETAEVSTATGLIFTGGMTLTRFTNVFAKLPIVVDPNGSSVVFPLVIARLTNTDGAASAADGLYYVTSRNTGTGVAVFKKLDGTNPDFTGAGTINVAFFSSRAVSNDATFARSHGYQYLKNNQAQNVIGAHGVDAVLLQVFTPNGNTGDLKMEVFADRIQFKGGLKKTNNILGDLDYSYLDGAESGTIVNADPSHHHSGYTRYAMCNPATPAATSAAALSTMLAGLVVTLTGVVPTNYRRYAVQLQVDLQITYDGAAVPGDTADWHFIFQPGSGLGGITLRESELVRAGELGCGRRFYLLTVAADAATGNTYRIDLISANNVDTTASVITITEIGQHLQSLNH